MKSRIFTLGVAVFILTAPVFADAPPTPYAGQQTRAIKALSDDDIASLLKGEGMGMAKAAELNGYPGPTHVLALAPQLKLTEPQRQQVQAIFDRMMQQRSLSVQNLWSASRCSINYSRRERSRQIGLQLRLPLSPNCKVACARSIWERISKLAPC